MTRVKVIIALFLSTTLILIGCGNIKPGHKIYRVNDILLVFLAMNNQSKIVDTTIENSELHVDIRTGKDTEKRVISLKEQFKLKIVKPHETARIQDTHRINGYGVVKLKVTPPVSGRMTMHINWTGLKVEGFHRRIGTFPNSGAFRVGNRITAYSFLTETKVPSLKKTTFGLKTELKSIGVFKNPTYEVNDHRVKNVFIDIPDVINKHISFLLQDLRAHEDAEVEDQKKLGDDVLIVNFKVSQKIAQPIRTFPGRSRPNNRPNLRDR